VCRGGLEDNNWGGHKCGERAKWLTPAGRKKKKTKKEAFRVTVDGVTGTKKLLEKMYRKGGERKGDNAPRTYGKKKKKGFGSGEGLERKSKGGVFLGRARHNRRPEKGTL